MRYPAKGNIAFVLAVDVLEINEIGLQSRKLERLLAGIMQTRAAALEVCIYGFNKVSTAHADLLRPAV